MKAIEKISSKIRAKLKKNRTAQRRMERPFSAPNRKKAEQKIGAIPLSLFL
ncbi:hypothetical protein [Bacillus smithii]|jgi:hypothetical protein|uniref:hypothetical protein n=1 Tax=Bacillus smithii TaxID=1479 RepID=UPI002E1BC7F1|nr:hypothetical protein [Bacillus smithii]